MGPLGNVIPLESHFYISNYIPHICNCVSFIVVSKRAFIILTGYALTGIFHHESHVQTLVILFIYLHSFIHSFLYVLRSPPKGAFPHTCWKTKNYLARSHTQTEYLDTMQCVLVSHRGLLRHCRFYPSAMRP
jgi:hypothetical protein